MKNIIYSKLTKRYILVVDHTLDDETISHTVRSFVTFNHIELGGNAYMVIADNQTYSEVTDYGKVTNIYDKHVIASNSTMVYSNDKTIAVE